MTPIGSKPGGWTYEEFARLPEDGNRYEVIAGELYVTPSPRPRHQLVITQLIVTLELFVRRHDLGRVFPGPIDVLFDQGDYLEPDLVFVRKDRLAIVSKRGLEAAPDLVVEVLSESTASRDRLLKKRRYAHFGVPEYWIVDPDAKQVEVYRFSERPDHGDVFDVTFEWRPLAGGPVLEVDVADLFDDIG